VFRCKKCGKPLNGTGDHSVVRLCRVCYGLKSREKLTAYCVWEATQ
jgi:hypothetical protein